MKDLLTEEIGQEFEGLKNMELGTKECETAINGITKLMEKAIELEKFEVEQQVNFDKQARQEELEDVKMELDKQERENRLYLQEKQLELQKKQVELQEAQQKHNKWNSALQILATVGIGLAGLAVTVWGTKYTTSKELDDGLIQTTEAGKAHTRGLFNRK